MRGPYSDYAAPPIYITPDRPKAGVRFSRTELYQLLVAILALSGAFTVLFIRYDFRGFATQPGVFLAIYFPTSLLAVGTGVGLHEVMHKVVAQRYGLWAEFRYNPQGLLLAFIFALVGFIFGAPGATWISGSVTPRQNGRISAAGPVTNLLIGAGSFAVLRAVAVGPLPISLANFALVTMVSEVAIVNAILAGFNMLPMMPLDGAKVWHWNKGVYLGIAAIAAVLIVAVFTNAFSV
ncbi:MAG TPA: hypothetical protein VF992_07190 [Thermoplasmata archaeon]